MVPGSTFRYGSHFCRVTLKPRLSRRQPIEEAATPFPSEDTTPPVTKIYFGAILIARVPTPGLFALHRSDVRIIMAGTRNSVKLNSPFPQNGFFLESLRLWLRSFFFNRAFSQTSWPVQSLRPCVQSRSTQSTGPRFPGTTPGDATT